MKSIKLLYLKNKSSLSCKLELKLKLLLFISSLLFWKNINNSKINISILASNNSFDFINLFGVELILSKLYPNRNRLNLYKNLLYSIILSIFILLLFIFKST